MDSEAQECCQSLGLGLLYAQPRTWLPADMPSAREMSGQGRALSVKSGVPGTALAAPWVLSPPPSTPALLSHPVPTPSMALLRETLVALCRGGDGGSGSEAHAHGRRAGLKAQVSECK